MMVVVQWREGAIVKFSLILSLYKCHGPGRGCEGTIAILTDKESNEKNYTKCPTEFPAAVPANR